VTVPIIGSPDMSTGLILLLVAAVAVAGSILPLSPMVPMLVSLGLLAGPALLAPVVIVAGVSEVVAKSVIYAAGAQTERALSPGRRAGLERARGYLTLKRPLRVVAILGSAVSGFPPFYAVTIAYGALRLPLADYLIAGAIGRSARYAGLILISRGVAEVAVPELVVGLP
jgi:membrane protein YqaA with SNARE-associated domain